MSTGNPPAGYYADPSVPGYIRYWDGAEWVAGTSRPAPEAVADQAPGSSQAGAVAAGGGAHARGAQQAETSREAAARPVASPAPGPALAPAPAPAPAVEPQPAPTAPAAESSVSTMIVPSAFGPRGNTYPNGYGYGYADPFAGLPGSPAAAQPGEQPEAEVEVVELAAPSSRLLARIIDLGLAALASAPVTVSLVLVAHRHDHQYVQRLDAEATSTYTTLGMDGLGIVMWAGALAALVVAAILIEGYQLGRGGQTVGKRLAGIRVVRLADGAPVTRRGAGTRRALLFWVLAILPLIDIAALGGVLWGRPYRQGAHERITATVTVKT